MKTSKLIFIALVGASLALAGCTTVNTVEDAQKQGQRQMISDQRAITDPSLSRKVAIVGVNVAMTPTGLLKVQVEVENHTRSIQRFLYHFDWFDANGMQLNNVISATLPDQIEGKESKFINSIAPNPFCRDFRVKFVEAN